LSLHMWLDLKKPGFHTHNIKLTISQEMDNWLNTLSYSFLWLGPCVSLEWHFGAIRWSWLLYWCLEGWTSHEGLYYLQFGVLWAHERSSRAPNWTSGFQLSSYSILYSYVKLTLHPHLQYHYRHEKSCSKQLESRMFESYSPTQL